MLKTLLAHNIFVLLYPVAGVALVATTLAVATPAIMQYVQGAHVVPISVHAMGATPPAGGQTVSLPSATLTTSPTPSAPPPTATKTDHGVNREPTAAPTSTFWQSTIVQEPVSTEASAPTETPQATEPPQATKAPARTETPSASETPGATETPQASKTPDSTASVDTPEAHNTPVATPTGSTTPDN